MIDNLCKNYGDPIAKLKGVTYYSFPTISQLMKATEDELRNLGFGYRAKYIVDATIYIEEKGGIDWLFALRKKGERKNSEGINENKGYW